MNNTVFSLHLSHWHAPAIIWHFSRNSKATASHGTGKWSRSLPSEMYSKLLLSSKHKIGSIFVYLFVCWVCLWVWCLCGVFGFFFVCLFAFVCFFLAFFFHDILPCCICCLLLLKLKCTKCSNIKKIIQIFGSWYPEA